MASNKETIRPFFFASPLSNLRNRERRSIVATEQMIRGLAVGELFVCRVHFQYRPDREHRLVDVDFIRPEVSKHAIERIAERSAVANLSHSF